MIIENLFLNTNPKLLIGNGYNFFKENPKEKFAGVYLIKNIENDKVYVGSSVDVKRRIGRHLKDLRNDKHDNSILGRSFNKYGEENFFFYLMEELPIGTSQKDCEALEQIYLDELKCFYHNKRGYNIAVVAGGGSNYNRGFSLSLKDPEGVIHEFTESIAEFSRKNNLLRSEVQNLFYGKSTVHKGWTLPQTVIPEKPIYTLQNIDGRIATFDNPKKFAEDNKICPENLYLILKGRFISCKGWHRVGEPPPTWELVNHDGEYFKIDSLIQFCRERGLNRGGIGDVVTGLRPYYAGWHLPHMPPQSEKSYQDGLRRSQRYKNSQD